MFVRVPHATDEEKVTAESRAVKSCRPLSVRGMRSIVNAKWSSVRTLQDSMTNDEIRIHESMTNSRMMNGETIHPLPEFVEFVGSASADGTTLATGVRGRMTPAVLRLANAVQSRCVVSGLTLEGPNRRHFVTIARSCAPH